uniref:Uncharacterized protein n=1 Tax=Larimichthys crocea TaxID=215358 RepID=A0A0F8AIR0_LARCR
MLQSWFPHIKPNLTDDGVQPKRQKHHHHHGGASLPPPPPPSSLASLCSSDVDPASLGSLYSTTHLKWLHTSPICSLKTPESMLVQRASSSTSSSTSPLPTPLGQEVTQDNAVSSSTDSHKTTTPLRRLGRGRLAFKISSPCLERLLQAKESIIAPRTDGGWMS